MCGSEGQWCPAGLSLWGSSPWQEPKLLTSCLCWSSQLQSFPGAWRLLDPVQCFSVMKIKINPPCSSKVCVCNQGDWTGAASPGCHCLNPCLLSSLHLTCTWNSLLRAREAALHHQPWHLSFCKVGNVYLHRISQLHGSLGRAGCDGEFVHLGGVGKQHCCDGCSLPCFPGRTVAVLAGG